jgi:hypothetical protein
MGLKFGVAEFRIVMNLSTTELFINRAFEDHG